MHDERTIDALRHFFSHVTKGVGAEACWVWHGSRSPQGYGLHYDRAMATTRFAHRWHWIVVVGWINDDRVIDHICRNRACIRLDHLRDVSPLENMLAGDSIPARNARKKTCAKGHPLVALRHGRGCPDCLREARRAAQKRRRQAQAKADTAYFLREWAKYPNLGGSGQRNLFPVDEGPSLG